MKKIASLIPMVNRKTGERQLFNRYSIHGFNSYWKRPSLTETTSVLTTGQLVGWRVFTEYEIQTPDFIAFYSGEQADPHLAIWQKVSKDPILDNCDGLLRDLHFTIRDLNNLPADMCPALIDLLTKNKAMLQDVFGQENDIMINLE